MADDRIHRDQWDQKLNDLPLPDSEASWQNMKQKLDDEDKQRRIIPPFILNCAAWSLLAIGLLAGGWFVYDLLSGSDSISKKSPGDTTINTSTSSSAPGASDNTHELTSTIPGDNQQIEIDKSSSKSEDLEKADVSSDDETIAINISSNTKERTPVKKNIDKAHGLKPSQKSIDGKQPPAKAKAIKNQDVVKEEVRVERETDAPQANKVTTDKDSLEIRDPNALQKDQGKKRDTSIKKEAEEPLPAVADNEKTSPGKKPKYHVSAGIGMHQQIPVGEQKSVSYNYYGKPNTVSDYIPSLYLRLHREEKWFIESGFRYGAPQAVPQFSYNQITSLDTVNNKVNRTSVFLRKTYYHQVPLSFNYYLLPNWSVGGGGVYSIFHGAVAEKEVSSYDYLNQSETINKSIFSIKEFNDSFLYKTQAHILLQTEYKWNRFSLGLRYTKGLESYIKYTMPDGTVVDEKNHSLEMMLRFRLWQSQKK